MKKYVFLFILTFICNLIQGQVWQREYGFFAPVLPVTSCLDATESANTVIQSIDGGYAAAGRTPGSNSMDQDVIIIKTDANGELLWQRVVGGTSIDYATGMVQVSNGDYFVSGTTESFGSGGEDVILIKLDSSGNLLWQKTYGDTGNDFSNGVAIANDGNIVMAGGTGNYGIGQENVYILKVDTSGTILWEKTYGDSGFEYATSISKVHDGGFIISGYTNTHGDTTGYFIRTDALGDSIWTKYYKLGNASFQPFNRASEMYSIIELKNNNQFIAAGIDANTSFENLSFVKLDLNGNLSNYSLSTYLCDAGYSIVPTSDSGFAICGFSSNFGTSMLLEKFDLNGQFQWRNEFGIIPALRTYGFFSYGASVIQSNDSGFVIAGCSAISGQANIYLVKTNSIGETYTFPDLYNSPGGIVSICDGDSLMFVAPTGYDQYQWMYSFNHAAYWIPNAVNDTFYAKQSGYYVCILTDSNGIFPTHGTTVNVIPIPTATILPAGYIHFCNRSGNNVNLNANQITPATYQWQLNGMDISGAVSSSFTPDSSGNYTVRISNSCGTAISNIDSVNAESPPYPPEIVNELGFPFDVNYYYGIPCSYPHYHLRGDPITGVTYSWLYNGVHLFNGLSIDIQNPGDWAFVASDSCGSDTTFINISAGNDYQPEISTSNGSFSACENQGVQLIFPEIGVWTYDTLFLTYGNQCLANQSGLYTIHFTAFCDDFYYDFTKSAFATIYLNPLVDISGNSSFCQGDTIMLNANSSANNYSWNTGSPDQQIHVNAPGVYFVEVTDNYGCVGTDSIVISQNPLPNTTIVNLPDTICTGHSSVMLQGFPLGGVFLGNTINNGYFITDSATLGYNLIDYMYTDSLGCTNRTTDSIFVDLCSLISFLNMEDEISFYPNPSDGKFYIMTNSTEFSNFEIINAMGEIIFVSDHLQQHEIFQIDLSGKSKGLLICKAGTESGKSKLFKLIVN